MKLKNGDIIIDDNFPCSSAGEMRAIESGISEIGYKPEEIPQWFQDVLDELFDGAGVPKEYMALRVVKRGLSSATAKWRNLRFHQQKARNTLPGYHPGGSARKHGMGVGTL